MLKKQFLTMFAVILAGCSGISLEGIDSSKRIAVLPSLNFSGHEISEFPVLIYRDAEIARLFRRVDTQSVNLSEIFCRKLTSRIKRRTDNIVAINADIENKVSAIRNYDNAFLQKIHQKHPFEQAYFCVITGLSMKNLFSKHEIYLRIQLVNIDNAGNAMHKTGKRFVIHVPDRAFTPIGADLSDIINEIAENIIAKLMN
ncbi:MAG: hypothetical protein K8S87_04615 [Planctomycetes bacterium]|nr:hypothetical protein [Planctomycetota bacterium]